MTLTMIAAGKLDRVITVERAAETVAPSGAVSQTWTPVATIRAELVQQSTEEFLAGTAEGARNTAVFRVRWRSDLKLGDRIIHAGLAYELKEIAEIGRRVGLELRTVSGKSETVSDLVQP